MNFQFPILLAAWIPLLGLGILLMKRAASTAARIQSLLLCFSLFFLILALANPYWRTEPRKTMMRQEDYVVILDVSQSMFCREAMGTRLDRALTFLQNFLPHLSGGPIAVVYFAGDAQIGVPLTPDLQAVRLFLDSITPGMNPEPGTHSRDLAVTLQDLAQDSTSSHHRQIGFLFSDGEFSDQTASLKSWLRSHSEFSLFTFACGRGKSPVPSFDLKSLTPGAFSQSNPESLRDLAESGRGQFFDISETTDSSAFSQRLDSEIHNVLAAGEQAPHYEFYRFLILSLIFFIAYRFFPIGQTLRIAPSKAATAALLIVITTALGSTPNQNTKFSEALRELNAKHYDKALTILRQLKAEGANEEVEVAIGNVLSAQGKSDEAIVQYRKALEANPSNQRARWNWEVLLKSKTQPQPPPPPQPKPKPQSLPDETRALLQYFDQKEKEQLKQLNAQQNKSHEFAW
ncbi:MAG TPA: VWA domain-containing protein [Acidobacteriota bacterium]|nr:VWA domain-containing protein [Acidobacteriota bacterium]